MKHQSYQLSATDPSSPWLWVFDRVFQMVDLSAGGALRVLVPRYHTAWEAGT